MAGHSGKRLDLTGQRFGKLTVLRPAENQGNLTAWVCRCDCGKEAVVLTKRLRDGRRTSCGCDRPPPGRVWPGQSDLRRWRLCGDDPR